MGKTVQPVQRRFQWLDRIAEARRHSHIQRLNSEIRSSEAAIAASPINPGGFQDQSRAYMLCQIMDRISGQRETLRYVENLTDDSLVEYFCQREIAESQAQPVTALTLNGEPVNRGGSIQPIAPGMPR